MSCLVAHIGLPVLGPRPNYSLLLENAREALSKNRHNSLKRETADKWINGLTPLDVDAR